MHHAAMFYLPFRKPSPVLALGAAPAKRAAKATKAVSPSVSLEIGRSMADYLLFPIFRAENWNQQMIPMYVSASTPYNHSCGTRPRSTVMELQRTGGCVNMTSQSGNNPASVVVSRVFG